VRDKLLGLHCNEDIDIALDNMTGKEFSIILNDWCHSKGLRTFNIGIIQQNPEKSKHLETGNYKIIIINNYFLINQGLFHIEAILLSYFLFLYHQSLICPDNLDYINFYLVINIIFVED
jgi:hypothetical protein